jgi:hypothetical protein
MLSNLSVGVDDWQRPELIRDYYPESLPEEWRADFYLNEFATVLIAQYDWSQWDDAWLEELEQAYRDNTALYFRIDRRDSIDQQNLREIVERLGEWLAGFVVFDATWPEQEIRYFERPVTFVSNHQAWSGWSWSFQGVTLSGAPCGWLQELPSEPKVQREILQDFVASLPDKNRAVPFFVGGESINMGRLQGLKTLAELLGY